MSCRRLALALATLLAAALPGAARAQTAADSAAIRAAAMDYIEGFYQGDSTRHARSIRPEVYKYGFWMPRDSTRYQGERMTWEEFNGYTARIRTRGNRAPATAVRKVELLDAQDQTAAVKVTAFWGTDYLLLGKYDGRWMVSSVLWQTLPRGAR